MIDLSIIASFWLTHAHPGRPPPGQTTAEREVSTALPHGKGPWAWRRTQFQNRAGWQ